MSLQALTAIATVVAHLSSGVAGGLLYLCKMDGQARRECCCPKSEQQGDGQKTRTTQVAVSLASCCEVSSVEPSRTPALAAEPRASHVPPPPALALPGPVAALDQAPASADPVRWMLDAAPPIGPPLYLRLRVLLN